jgi:Asp-tRNA(Asn)/Glu-tRNA(Gln) amidotransferase A subunit family amidase
MTGSTLVPDDTLMEAASLAFAMVRFEEVSAHWARHSSPPGVPRLGVDTYSFLPSSRRVPRDGVAAFLAGLSSPAILTPSTMRGVVALILVDELSGDRAVATQKEFSNQMLGLEEMVQRIGLDADASVLLDFENEVNVFSLKAVRVWAERFAVHVGWSVETLKDDPRASARIILYGSDGRNSHGERRPPRPLS